MSTPRLAVTRKVALDMARWSARRLESCEAHYFATLVRSAATGSAEDHRRCERWRRLAGEYRRGLGEDVEALAGAGMREAGLEIVEEAGRRIRVSRERCCRANGLRPEFASLVRMAWETAGVGPAAWRE